MEGREGRPTAPPHRRECGAAVAAAAPRFGAPSLSALLRGGESRRRPSHGRRAAGGDVRRPQSQGGRLTAGGGRSGEGWERSAHAGHALNGRCGSVRPPRRAASEVREKIRADEPPTARRPRVSTPISVTSPPALVLLHPSSPPPAGTPLSPPPRSPQPRVATPETRPAGRPPPPNRPLPLKFRLPARRRPRRPPRPGTRPIRRPMCRAPHSSGGPPPPPPRSKGTAPGRWCPGRAP